MKVALVCCGRLENRYAEEFIEHYNQLGVDHIFIIDNNYDGEEHFEDVLQSYIDEGLITILDYRNKERIQIIAFKEIYDQYENEYDYMMFFDFDEFLILKNYNSIKDYLKNNKDFDVICINWRIYTDNDLLYYDNRKCIERFNVPTDESYNLNFFVKSIIKTGLKNINWTYTHIPHTNYNINELRYCDNKFDEIIFDSIFHMESYYDESEAYIKHFMTKTVEEFISKLKRGGGTTFKETINKFRIDEFFNINKRTKEKENILNNYLESLWQDL